MLSLAVTNSLVTRKENVIDIKRSDETTYVVVNKEFLSRVLF